MKRALPLLTFFLLCLSLPQVTKAADWCRKGAATQSFDCYQLDVSGGDCAENEDKFSSESECKEFKWCITATDKCERTATCAGTQYSSMNECVLGLEAAANTGNTAGNSIEPMTGGKGTIVHLINPIGGSDSNPQGILAGKTGSQGLYEIVGKLLKAGMGILGSVALLAFVYGGFEWVTAAGNSDKISNGASAMTWAAIGICVIFSSYAIINLLFSTLTDGGGTNVDTTVQAGDVWCVNKQNVCAAMPANECSGNKYTSQGECQNAVNFVGPPQVE